MKIQQVVEKMAQRICGFISLSVVGIDGLAIVEYARKNFDHETVNAQFTLVIQMLQRSIQHLGVTRFDNHIVTTKNCYLFTGFLGDQSFWLGIVIDRKRGNLGNLQLIVQQYSTLIGEAIPKKQGLIETSQQEAPLSTQ